MVSSKAAPHDFAAGDTIVYPAHGVGTVASIEETEVAGYKLELLVLNFAREKMTVRVPRAKVKSSGLRKVVTAAEAEAVLDALSGRARRSRGLWSRRAQEYEGKINSGDLSSIAEVVRDLHRAGGDPGSYSERNIYESAFARLVGELAVALDRSETEATAMAHAKLGQRVRAAGADEDAESEAEAA